MELEWRSEWVSQNQQEVEANPVVNMTASCQCRVQAVGGYLGDGGLLGGTMAGVDGTIGVNETVGMEVASESVL